VSWRSEGSFQTSSSAKRSGWALYTQENLRVETIMDERFKID
jgi:hypothetical protein